MNSPLRLLGVGGGCRAQRKGEDTNYSRRGKNEVKVHVKLSK